MLLKLQGQIEMLQGLLAWNLRVIHNSCRQSPRQALLLHILDILAFLVTPYFDKFDESVHAQ